MEQVPYTSGQPSGGGVLPSLSAFHGVPLVKAVHMLDSPAAVSREPAVLLLRGCVLSAATVGGGRECS